jgi:tetratricopeptide (TPR) repeat protein
MPLASTRSCELALWTETARIEPGSLTAQDNLGWALVDAGRPAEALPAFQRAVELGRGTSADPYAGAALALLALGQPERALIALRRAISVEPLYGDPAALERTRRLRPHHIAGLRPLLSRLPPSDAGSPR